MKPRKKRKNLHSPAAFASEAVNLRHSAISNQPLARRSLVPTREGLQARAKIMRDAHRKSVAVQCRLLVGQFAGAVEWKFRDRGGTGHGHCRTSSPRFRVYER